MASEFLNNLIVYSFEYQNEYSLKWRNVKIFPKVLEEKRKFTPEEKARLTRKGFYWYVYFDYVNPETGKFERQQPIKNKINRKFPDFDDRLRAIMDLKSALIELLKDGHSPYQESKEKQLYTVSDCLDFALDIKKKEVSERTYKTYKSHCDNFKEWLSKNGYANTEVKDIDKRTANLFLNHIASKNSNRTRNNYKSSLRALFSTLEDYDYIEKNIFNSIKNLETAEKTDPTYSAKQVKTITDYLKENDRVMLMYIYFVSYMFWRPKENCRLKVKDIDLTERTMNVPTKTKGSKKKYIPDILIGELQDYLKGSKPEDFVFTPEGVGPWNTKLDNRRNYFTQRYFKIKEALKLDSKYTIYSFRHTYATLVYKRLLEQYTKPEALEKLSLITGHESNALLEYLHHIDAFKPEDYSDLLK